MKKAAVKQRNAEKTSAPLKPIQNISFPEHIKKSKYELGLFFLATVCWCVFLNYCYPVADMSSDTGGYIHFGLENTHGGYRPLGYSYFIKFVHQFSHDTFAVFIGQLGIFFLAYTFFYVSITWFFDIANKYIRAAFLLLSIFFISGFYTTNVMLTESLFLSLSVIMITACLWFTYMPNVVWYLIIVVSMMLCITIRYIGMVYPVIIAIAFFYGLKKKWVAAGATAFLVIVIVGYMDKVADETENDIGYGIFSGFEGWQKANNALHILPHIDRSKPLVNSDDPEIQMVDSFVRATYETYKSHYPKENEVSYQFIWSDSLPLKPILYRKRMITGWLHFHAWNYLGRVYSDYGNLLIKEYPKEFFKYYFWINFKSTLYPPVESFDKYLYTGKTDSFARQWFDLDKKMRGKPDIEPAHDLLRPVLKSLPAQYCALWFGFFAVLASVFAMLKNKIIDIRSHTFVLCVIMVTYVVIYSLANVYGSPLSLRYLIPARVFIVALMVICIDIIIKHYEKRRQLANSAVKN